MGPLLRVGLHQAVGQYGKFTTPFVIGLVIDYCKQEIEIKDEDGNVVDIKLGIDSSEDLLDTKT